VAWSGSVAGQQTSWSPYNTPAYLQFSDPSYTAAEGGTNVLITVVRTGEFRIPISVQYSTQGGTAQPGRDYQAIQGTLQIAAGAGFATFEIPVLPNSQRDQAATVQLTLSNPGPQGLITTGQATLTLPATTQKIAASAPALAVEPVSNGQVMISWEATTGSYVLEKSVDLLAPNWIALGATPAVSNGKCSVVEAVSSGRSFYRLRSL
jgi:hypothetical protein